MPVLIDATHLRATLTGIERITTDLFSPHALSPLPVELLRAEGTAGMIRGQQVANPLALLRDRSSILICPGFPPALTLLPFRGRVIPYIHDTFLMSRWSELNPRAKAYMALPFRVAVARYPVFFVNSEQTRDALRRLCRPDAEILLYRPEVPNVFEARPASRPRQEGAPRALKLIAIGTVEPRKNYRAAARAVQALRDRGIDASLTVAGRNGWGEDWKILQSMPGVTLLGYSTEEQIRAELESADVFISTSHEEGLGLPLLEAQHAGLPILAPDIPVFREVLGDTGVLFTPSDANHAAEAILAYTRQADWRERAASAAQRNLARWNSHAARDRQAIIGYLAQRIGPDQVRHGGAS